MQHSRKPETGVIVVLCAAAGAESAEGIARALVEARLAACVNIVPGVLSVYRWKGEVCREPECLLLVKTRAENFEAVRREIRRLHTYEVPEIAALPITAGDGDYLAWLGEAAAPLDPPC